jgi:hypothetical protein
VAPTAEIDRARLEAHVQTLASASFGGRGMPDDREKAWAYVADALVAAGVKPVPGATSLRRAFAAKPAQGLPAGANVVGWIAGTDPAEYVVLSAHFDHLGRRKDVTPKGDAPPHPEVMFPGADDNASGTAAMIEIARALAAGPKLRRSVLVLGFDLEEVNCGGSRAYCESPALPLSNCAAFTTIDMLGRSMGDLFPGLLLVMGGERADALASAAASFAVAPGVVVRELGMDFNQLGWSDYLPFEEKKVPCLFFTSGACRDYHRETDTADKLDGEAFHARAATLLAAMRGLAGLPDRPIWKDVASPRLVEIEALHALVKEAGAHEEDLQVPPAMRAMRKNFEDNLAKAVGRGTVTVGERTVFRNVALMLFQAASQAR